MENFETEIVELLDLHDKMEAARKVANEAQRAYWNKLHKLREVGVSSGSGVYQFRQAHRVENGYKLYVWPLTAKGKIRETSPAYNYEGVTHIDLADVKNVSQLPK